MGESKRPRDDVPSDVQAALCPSTSVDVGWSGWIERIGEGDQHALAALYDASSSLVYGLILRIVNNPADAEEVALDVFQQIWRKARDYSPARGSALTWIVMLARTRAIDRVRRMATRTKLEQPIDEGMESRREMRAQHPGPEQQSAEAECRRRLCSALNKLALEQREALQLAFFSGYTHSELSMRLGAPLGTVKTRIRLGMLRLRKELEETA